MISNLILILVGAFLIMTMYKLRSVINGHFSWINKLCIFTLFLLITMFLVLGVMHNLPGIEGELEKLFKNLD